jgi:hypothetical protein
LDRKSHDVADGIPHPISRVVAQVRQPHGVQIRGALFRAYDPILAPEFPTAKKRASVTAYAAEGRGFQTAEPQ